MNQCLRNPISMFAVSYQTGDVLFDYRVAGN
jgi:hypothetical protein